MAHRSSTKQKENKRKVRSFAGRLTKWIVLVMLVVMGLVSYIIYSLVFELIKETQQMHNEALLDASVENIRRVVSDVYVGTKNHVPEIEESLGQPDRMFTLVERVVRQNKRIHSCGISFVADYYPQKGHWFCPYAVRRDDGTIEKQNFGNAQNDYLEAPWFTEAINAKEGFWSKPFFEGNDSITPLVSYLVPIHDKQGKTVAVLGADLSLEWLREKTQRLDTRVYEKGWIGEEEESEDEQLSEEEKIKEKQFQERKAKRYKPHSFIITSDGTYLAHPDQKRILRENFFTYAKTNSDTTAQIIGQKMVKGEEGCSTDEEELIKSFEFEGRSVYLFYAPIEKTDWSMAIVVPAIGVNLMAGIAGFTLLFFILIGVIVVYLMSRFTIRRAAKPLKQLAYSADEVANGNFDTPLPHIKHDDEIRLLRDSFDGMQQSLTQYIEELKSTTASKAAIENELKVAHDIQMSMLPKIFPPYPERNDISIYGSLDAAKDVGGDLFDFYIRDNKLFFCIGDVSGKGVPASLVMAVTRSLFRNISNNTSDPSLIVSMLNNALTEGNEKNMFVTLFVGVLHLENGLLQYCNAGHDTPLLIGRGVGMLPCEPNLPVGVMEDWNYTLQEVSIYSQTTIFLYTDGLNEAEDIHHAQFGNQRIIDLAETLLAEGRNQPEIIITSMTEAVHTFVGDAEKSDDLTMLAIKYTNTNGQQEEKQA